MNNYLVTMTLESDACFGAGISKNGLVNTEVLIDDSGFPYFLAKTFKGVLKESIENILVPAEESLKDSEREILRDLRRDEFENDIKYKFTWSNFKIDQVIKEAFEDENLKSLEKSAETSAKHEAFMNIEQSTRITQNQVAEENSLRAIRVVKKGLVFTSLLSVNKELDGDEMSFLKTCLKTVKHIGTSKNRGLGKVKLDLITTNSNNETSEKISKKINRESKFIKYEIEIEEPVKIAKSEQQYDYEPTQKYIPASVMRGAIISSILENVDQNKKDEIALKFIKNAKYYNAYPIYSASDIEETEPKTKDPNRKLTEVKAGKLDRDVKLENKDYYSIPMPNIFRNNKQVQKAHKAHSAWIYTEKEPDDIEIRDSKGKIETFNYSTIFDRKKNMDLLGSKFMNKFTPGEFCYIAATKDEEDALFAFDIETEEYFHHTHQKSHENIYRYEAIKPKYRYYGFIDISSIEESESDLKDGMINQLENLDKLWIGGSKNTGYGRVKLTKWDAYKDENAAFVELGIAKADSSVKGNSILDDDCIYFYSDYVSGESLDDLGSSIAASISTANITGYNTKWSAKTPMLETIAKGSVIKLAKDERKDDSQVKTEKIENISKKLKEKAGLTEEGFGVMIKNPKMFDAKKIYIHEPKDGTIDQKSTLYRASKKKTLDEYKYFFNDYAKAYLDRRIKKILAPAIGDASFGIFLRNVKESLGKNFRTKANELIQIIDDSKIWGLDVAGQIQEWKDNMLSISMNREQIEQNYAFLDLSIIGKYSFEEIVTEKLSTKKSSEQSDFDKIASTSGKGIHIDMEAEYNNLSEEIRKIRLGLQINNAEIINKNIFVVNILRQILYYTVQCYDQNWEG